MRGSFERIFGEAGKAKPIPTPHGRSGFGILRDPGECTVVLGLRGIYKDRLFLCPPTGGRFTCEVFPELAEKIHWRPVQQYRTNENESSPLGSEQQGELFQKSYTFAVMYSRVSLSC